MVSRPQITAGRIAGAYAVAGSAWLLVPVPPVPVGRAPLFVGVTALLLFTLVHRERRVLTATEDDLRRVSRQSAVLRRVLRHDVRNRVNATRGYAALIHDRTDEPETEDLAQEIIDSANALVETSDKAKTLDRIAGPDTSDPRPVNLSRAVREGVDRVTDRYPHAEVEVDLPEALRVRADPRIDDAVENLVENAVIHSDDPAPRVRIDCRERDGDVTVAVADDCPAIPPVERRVIEAETETDLVHSIGLGLRVCQAAVTRSGGEVRVDPAEDGEGNVVEVTLPRASRDRLERGRLPIPQGIRSTEKR